MILDGKAIAARIQAEIAEAVVDMKREHGVTPGLATVLVGGDPASQMYVRMKHNRCEEVGINSFGHELPDDATQQDVIAVVEDLNADARVHGILVQLPMPDHIDEEAVLTAIDAGKDVDGLHPMNTGRLAQKGRVPLFIPATPRGCMVMLHEAEQLLDDFAIEGSDAVVIGRSNIVGMPMALLLIEANATVTVAHSRTRDLEGLVRNADILVSAVGRPGMVPGEWIKPGAVVIDVATVKVDAPDTKKGYAWKGDVEFETANERAAAITPVPGGVGPMTIAMLLSNTLHAAQHAIETTMSV